MNLLKQYWPHIAGAAAGSGSLLAIIFRDGIKDIIADWRKERDAKRSERLASASRIDSPMRDVFQLLRDELKAQRELISADIVSQRANDKEIIAILAQVATSNERHLDMERTFSTQFSEFDKRLGRIEGAVNMLGGRTQ